MTDTRHNNKKRKAHWIKVQSGDKTNVILQRRVMTWVFTAMLNNPNCTGLGKQKPIAMFVVVGEKSSKQKEEYTAQVFSLSKVSPLHKVV